MSESLPVHDVPDGTRDAPAGRPAPEDLWDRVERRVRSAGTRLPAADVLGLRDRDRT